MGDNKIKQSDLNEIKRILSRKARSLGFTDSEKHHLRACNIDIDNITATLKPVVLPKSKPGASKAIPTALKLLLDTLPITLAPNTILVQFLKQQNPDIPFSDNLFNKRFQTYERTAMKKIIKESGTEYTESLIRGCDSLSEVKKKLKKDWLVSVSQYDFKLDVALSGDSVVVNSKTYPKTDRSGRECIRATLDDGKEVWVRLDALLALE